MLQKVLLNTCLHCINSDEPFAVECDVSDLAIGATLNQSDHPVAFILGHGLKMNPSVEKEGTAIIKPVFK